MSDLQQIDKYLDTLGVTPAGLAQLALMCDSCDNRLVSPSDVREFLLRCVARHAAHPHEKPVDVFGYVAEMPEGRNGHRFLRLCKQRGIGTAHRRFNHVVSYVTFHAHHIEKAAPPPLAPVLPYDAPTVAEDQLKLAEQVRELTSRSGWMDRTAVLGRPNPHPSSCWISVDGFTDERPGPTYHPASTEADRVRDMLGLIHYEAVNVHLLRYEFDALPTATQSSTDMARPAFADRGNARFRIIHHCRRGKAMAHAGWGATVNLFRLRHRRLHPCTGVPERVTAALPLAQLANLSVNYLGGTTHALDNGGDADLEFAKLLCRRRRLPGMKRRVLAYVRTVTAAPR